MAPFEYPDQPHARRHGPQGYAGYESYRPWLRDEFTFRCVYCLKRERWGHVLGAYDIDHFQPASVNAALDTEYDNLLYACARCNLAKRNQEVPDPTIHLTTGELRVSREGYRTGLPKRTEQEASGEVFGPELTMDLGQQAVGSHVLAKSGEVQRQKQSQAVSYGRGGRAPVRRPRR